MFVVRRFSYCEQNIALEIHSLTHIRSPFSLRLTTPLTKQQLLQRFCCFYSFFLSLALFAFPIQNDEHLNEYEIVRFKWCVEKEKKTLLKRHREMRRKRNICAVNIQKLSVILEYFFLTFFFCYYSFSHSTDVSVCNSIIRRANVNKNKKKVFVTVIPMKKD